MGLDTSHGCWEGGYISFNVWRNILTELAGYWVVWSPAFDDENQDAKMDSRLYNHYPLVFIDWGHITDENLMGYWERMPSDPLIVLIAHHDTDGVIAIDHTGPLADRLDKLLPLITDEIEDKYKFSMRKKTETFIQGLREADASMESVTFG